MARVPTCPPCRRVAADQRAEQRKAAYLRGADRLVDACGVRRRLNALAAIGWSRHALAAELGCDRSNVQKIIRSARSTPETAAAVRALYDRLSMIPGPHPAAAAVARRRGWPPPLAWDDDELDDPKGRPNLGRAPRNGPAPDEVAVQRAMRGDPVALHPVERSAAVHRLTAAGHSAAEIAARLGTTKRSVTRHRSTDTTRRSA